MKSQTTSYGTNAVNIAAGFALLVMLFPHHGKLPEKPTGVRTAIEMITKKPSLRQAISEISTAA